MPWAAYTWRVVSSRSARTAATDPGESGAADAVRNALVVFLTAGRVYLVTYWLPSRLTKIQVLQDSSGCRDSLPERLNSLS